MIKDGEELIRLYTRAREAIEARGLDEARLDLAVSAFGWGSDEANGSLLGFVRWAWGSLVWRAVIDVLDTPCTADTNRRWRVEISPWSAKAAARTYLETLLGTGPLPTARSGARAS